MVGWRKGEREGVRGETKLSWLAGWPSKERERRTEPASQPGVRRGSIKKTGPGITAPIPITRRPPRARGSGGGVSKNREEGLLFQVYVRFSSSSLVRLFRGEPGKWVIPAPKSGSSPWAGGRENPPRVACGSPVSGRAGLL